MKNCVEKDLFSDRYKILHPSYTFKVMKTERKSYALVILKIDNLKISRFTLGN